MVLNPSNETQISLAIRAMQRDPDLSLRAAATLCSSRPASIERILDSLDHLLPFPRIASLLHFDRPYLLLSWNIYPRATPIDRLTVPISSSEQTVARRSSSEINALT